MDIIQAVDYHVVAVEVVENRDELGWFQEVDDRKECLKKESNNANRSCNSGSDPFFAGRSSDC